MKKPPARPNAVRVKPMALHALNNRQLADRGLTKLGEYVVKARPFQAPILGPNVLPLNPRDRARHVKLPGERMYMALDSATVAPLYAWANQNCGAVGFPGYPYLAELALRSEYRSPAETTAKEMTRRWIKLKSASAGDKTAKIEQLDKAMKEFQIRELWRKAVEFDYYMGRYQLYLKIKGQDSDQGRQLPLLVDEGSGALGKDCLLSISGIEPIWTTPYSYNSTDPTEPDFFNPTSWFVLGKKTHATRLLNFISRPVPDLFKPAYNFGGLSMSQLMEPYVMQWFRTRDAVSDAVYNYSTSGVMTNMSTLLEEDDSGKMLQDRAEMFNRYRGNRGLMLLDKDSEEFFQHNTPLSSLDKLQAQAQEHMSAPCHTPLVKLTGITPSGLNASSEGEIEVYNDFLHSEQVCTDPQMLVVLKVVQMHCFGSVDPDIVHEWVPLREPTAVELGQIRKGDADAGSAYITNGVISPEEERERLQDDPNSGYNNLSGPPPEQTPEEDMLDQTQEHTSEESDKDREHGAGEGDKDRDAAAAALKAKAKQKPPKKA